MPSGHHPGPPSAFGHAGPGIGHASPLTRTIGGQTAFSSLLDKHRIGARLAHRLQVIPRGHPSRASKPSALPPP